MRTLTIIVAMLAIVMFAIPAYATQFIEADVLIYGPMEFNHPKDGEPQVSWPKKTLDVKGAPGEAFGVLFKLNGMPEGNKMITNVKIIFPKGGIIKDGEKRGGLYFPLTVTLGEPAWTAYKFGKDNPVVMGQYVIEVWAGGTCVVQAKFKVSK